MNISNTIQFASHQPGSFSLIQDSALGNSGTEGFDFLNALLGLQTSSEASQNQLFEQGLIQSDPNQEILEGDKALLEIFGKKRGFDEFSAQAVAFGVSLPGDYQVAPLGEESKNLTGLDSKSNTDYFSRVSKNEATLPERNQIDQFEDPLERIKFEMGIKNSNEKTLSENAAPGKNSHLQTLQQRGKQVSSFQSPSRVSLSASVKVDGDEGLKPQSLKTEMSSDKADHSIRKKENRDSEALFFESATESISLSEQKGKVEVSDKRLAPVSVPEVFQKVDSLVHNGGGKMTVSLTPPELGQVEIQVVTKGKSVEVKVKSESDFAKSAIENQLGDLKQSLQSQDLHLSKIEVQVSRELSPSFLENQFAGFFQNGNNPYRNSGAYQEKDNLGTPWERKPTGPQSQSISAVSTSAIPVGVGYREPGRLDIRI